LLKSTTRAQKKPKSADPQNYSPPSGVEWDGVEWSGMEWDGVRWSGVEWDGVGWSGGTWVVVRVQDEAGVPIRSPNFPLPTILFSVPVSFLHVLFCYSY